MRRAFLDRQQAQQGHLLCLFLIEGSTCLSLWERWPSEARSERVNRDCKKPSQSPAAAALPEGEPSRGHSCLSLWERWPSEARSERVNCDCKKPSQSPAVTALPAGEPRGRALSPLPEGEPSAMNCFISFPRNRRRRRHRRSCCSGFHSWPSRGIPRSGRCARRPRSEAIRVVLQPRPSVRDPWI